MKKKLLAILLALLLLLSACQYMVVEDTQETLISLFPAAMAEDVRGSTFDQQPVVEDVPLLSLGSRDEDANGRVKQLQQALIALGFLSGTADGIFGMQTQQALMAFQQHNGLEATGAADESQLALLLSGNAVPMPTPAPTLIASGARGEDVKTVQTQLQIYGFLTGNADGDFGAMTDAALRDFQRYMANYNDFEFVYATPTPQPTPTPVPTPAPTPDPRETMSVVVDATIAPTPTPVPPYEPDGIVSDELMAYITGGNFPVFREVLQNGSSGDEVIRLQTRLCQLWYLNTAVDMDGAYGPRTVDAIKYFQSRNGLEQTGVADEATQRLLFSAQAVKSDRPACPYLLKISVSDQKVYAYEWANGSYSRLVRSMTCSTGTTENPTPYGTFSAGGACGRWYYFKKFDCWAQYAYRITGGILFHSVLYSEKDTSTLRQGSVNALGSRASHGCIRLKVEDAKWIYNNCPAGTTVTVY